MEAFKHTMIPTTATVWTKHGHERSAEVWVRVDWDGKRLSLVGVEGPRSNGDAWGSCGQTKLDPQNARAPWTPDQVAALASLWDRWHLNDMRAACEHQRANWNTAELLEVVTYGINGEAHKQRRAAEKEANDAARAGRVANLDEAGRFLIGPDWFRDRFEPPDADSPLSGLYDVRKRETKSALWVYPSEHPRGLMAKPCEVCGYKLGTQWLVEAVPDSVLEILRAFPAAESACPWPNL